MIMMIMLLLSIFSLSNNSQAFSLSFNFSSFGPNDSSITYEGSATLEKPVIFLTTSNKASYKSGRAVYHEPMHLWDKTTMTLADFTTHFSFKIDSLDSDEYGDGLAFFLANSGSKLPHDVIGGSMGLSDSFVAVEFDVYKNDWDPSNAHVGVDVNSVISDTTVKWWADIKGGKLNEAWIRYNSSLKNLTVAFNGFKNGTILQQQLSAIVDFRSCLPEWVTFGFSAATGNATAVHSLYSWDFISNLNESIKMNQRKKVQVGLVVGLSIGGFVLIIFSLICFGFWKKWKDNEELEESHVFDEYKDEEFERGTGPRKFKYAELASATDNFKDDRKLGQGGFGAVYKGCLKDLNSYVAIKKISEGSKQGIKEFSSEVRIVSQLRHKNLVKLIGWCNKRKELLLVYEFMPNGSLDFHLFNNQSVLLNWEIRYKIAQGLACALLYLHEEWEQCVIHRDIKSSNIMLDSNFNPKLGDFGLARLVDHAKGSQTATALVGTRGYMAPEYLSSCRASKESDIYSFGIVVLEIACGRKPINLLALQDEMIMVKWVWNLYGSGRVLEAADSRLNGNFETSQIHRLMVTGLWCAHPDHNSRPSIRQAIQVLNFETPLPSLPTSFPVPTYARQYSVRESELQNRNLSFCSSDISTFVPR